MKIIGKALLGASVAAAGLPAKAHADDIVRGVIGLGTAIILNEMNRQPPPPRQYQPRHQHQHQTRPRQPSAQELQAREDRREVQRRLNMLGFDAGTPDGVYGPRTRSAISAFQASIGQQPTGRITEEQIMALYSRADGAGMANAQQHAFPPVGHNGQQGGGFFPPVNGNAPQAANAFPPLGGAAGHGNQQAASAFPPLGGAQSQQGAAAFPAIGAGAQDRQAGTAFPALSAGTANGGEGGQQMPAFAAPNAAGTGAFPVIGAPSGESGQGAGAMPTLSAVAAPQETGVGLPSLAAPAEEETAAQAGMALAPTAEAMAQTRTLAGELGRTVFAQGAQPAVIGVSLGQDFEEAYAAFGEDGFDNCTKAEDNSSAQCLRQSETINDQLRLYASVEQGIWAIARTIAFKTPVPANALNDRFSSAYPELMAQSSSLKAISSEPVCSGSTMSQSDLSSAIHRIEVALSRPQEDVSQEAMEFSYRCPVVYSLGFSGSGGLVSQVDITFVNATVVDDVANRRKAQEREQVDTVSNDLRL